jgi:GT2 family glycosyltransferase/glycosyltransferase involved in cell wall biosynthesis
MEFDPRWYRNAYGKTIGIPFDSDEALLNLYLEKGQQSGHSPNPFFDESWYLRIYPDVTQLVAAGQLQSGFDHYCRDPSETRRPHWLFDPRFYGEQYPDLAAEHLSKGGYANRYDHFLRAGDAAGRNSSLFFSAEYYRSELDLYEARRADTEGGFKHYLRRFRISLPELQVSPYFDPVWYLRRYPVIAAEVSRGIWRSALDHFLSNPTPLAFDPLPIFSESYYLQHHPDVARSLEEPGGVRSGYEHFIRYGIAELRRFNPQIDLQYYLNAHSSVRVDLEQRRAPNVFVHLLTIGATLGRATLPAGGGASAPLEDQTKAMFRQEAANLSRRGSRRPIDFSYDGAPRLSVLMVLHNQFPLTLAALSSLRSNYADALQVILVDSGSTDHTLHLDRYLRGVRLIRSEANIGFVRACNVALEEAQADVVLYLNNDILLDPCAIENGLDRILSSPDIGAVGGKVIRTHGRMQEAGNIIWRDGRTNGYMRGASPLAPEVNFVRDVDFCSGVFLMARTALVKELGGFDTDYAPAYYEETDLCVRILQAGYRVVYDPDIGLHHLEYGSTTSSHAALAQIAKNRAVFVDKHKKWLAGQPALDEDKAVFARTRRSRAKRILIVEDNIPLRFAGSGYVRSNDIIAVLAEMRWEITVFPINRHDFEIAAIYADFPDTVEVMHDRSFDSLKEFLEERKNYYDIIWVGRTHNLDRMKEMLLKLRAESQLRLVLDTESIFAVRHQHKAALDAASLPFDLESAMKTEFRNAQLCDAIVAVNHQEAEALRRMGLGPLCVLGHLSDVRLTPRGFDDRHGLLFVGAMHGESSPNYDSLCWFVDHVLYLVAQELGPEAHLTIVGHTAADADLRRFRGDPRLTLLGSVADLEPHYDRHRIFIAPTRIAAGLPYKVHEAASFGLPVVASRLLQEQTSWQHGEELLAASTTDPAAFADEIVKLYRSQALWHHLRQGAAERLARENSRAGYRHALETILSPCAIPASTGDLKAC